MRDELTRALKVSAADYIEIRIEENQAARLVYHGKRLEEVGRTYSFGGNVRALVKGGWGFVSFNNIGNLRDSVKLAIKEASLIGKEDFHLVPREPIIDLAAAGSEGPKAVSLETKKRLLDEYNDIILSTPKIQTSSIGCQDSQKKITFANSEGAYIEQTRADINLRLTAIAADNGEVQQIGLSIGSPGDFTAIKGLHKQVKEIAQRAVNLLSAPHAKGGEYTVVLDPVLAGVFAHEAFGHLSEADHVYENKHLQEIMVLGRKFGDRYLNIVDGAAVPGLRGSYKYDDEGVPATKHISSAKAYWRAGFILERPLLECEKKLREMPGQSAILSRLLSE